MAENQSSSKKERIDHQCGIDLLSDLPLSIIHIILDLIPFRDAVRTSILSREWRYTWASLPHLVLDEKCVNSNDKSRDELEDCMKNVVTHVLSRHKGPIHKLKMSFFFESSLPDIDGWILRLSRNNIKELVLEMGAPDYHLSPRVRSSIYSCEKLTELELENCRLGRPPSSFKGFLFLRCLSLNDVVMSHKTIESLVANSPVLERIELVEFSFSKLRITAPNLKSVYLHGECAEISMYAPLLSEMLVRLIDDDLLVQHQQQKSAGCPYTNLIGSSTNLEKLTGDSYFVKYLSKCVDSCHRSLVFHHLIDLELLYVNFQDIKEITVVARLIIAAPNVQKLKISTDLEVRETYDSESPEIRFSDFGCAPDFTFEKLRDVTMEDISGFPSEVEFVVFLLQSSPVLETMKVRHLDTLSSEEEKALFDELLGCGWASENAELLTPIR